MAEPKFEFNIKTELDGDEVGYIKYGGFTISGIFPNYKYYSHTSVTHSIELVNKMLAGVDTTDNRLNFKTDGLVNVGTYTNIVNDVFRICHINTNCDIFTYTLECSYSENKPEIDKFLIFLLQKFIVIQRKNYARDYVIGLVEAFQKLKTPCSAAEMDEIIDTFISMYKLQLLTPTINEDDETHRQFLYGIIAFMTSKRSTDKDYFKEQLTKFNVPQDFLENVFASISKLRAVSPSEPRALFVSQ